MSSIPDVNKVLEKELLNHGIQVFDFTTPIHSLKYNHPLFLRPGNALGIVLHNTGGLALLPNLVETWKNKEPNPPPSHLAIDQTGAVGRYVRLQYSDRATEHTLQHLSIEFQAVENGDITEKQIISGAVIVAFAHLIYGIQLNIADSRKASGVAHHSLFVEKNNPKGHSNCPSQAIISRKLEIISYAEDFAAKMSFDDEPAGIWEVKVEKWIWIYTFDPNGNVTWRDKYNTKEAGKGTWKIAGDVISFAWQSGTKESWNLPLQPAAQTGVTTMDGTFYEVFAVRQRR